MTNSVIKVKMPLSAMCRRWCMKLKLFLLYTHHDGSPRQRVLALAEEGGLSASTVGELYGVLKSTARAWLQKYWWNGQVGGLRATGLWHVSSPAQDVALVAEAKRNPFVSARDLKAATCSPWQRRMVILRLKEAGLRAQDAAVKELLIDERKLYRLAFAGSIVDRKWGSVIFSDESTFCS